MSKTTRRLKALTFCARCQANAGEMCGLCAATHEKQAEKDPERYKDMWLEDRDPGMLGPEDMIGPAVIEDRDQEPLHPIERPSTWMRRERGEW